MAGGVHLPPLGSSGHQKRAILITAVLLSLGITAALGAVVSGAIYSIVSTADELDETRAAGAAASALESLRSQMAGTVRDNAFWDEAYRQLASPTRDAWLIENWGFPTLDYPLYDMALVIGPDDKPLLSYRYGKAMDVQPGEFFDSSLARLVERARAADGLEGDVHAAFIGTMHGSALIGAARIRPFLQGIPPPGSYTLIFAKDLDAKTINGTARKFNLGGLQLTDSAVDGTVAAPLRDVDGNAIGFLSLPSEKPGTHSYERVRPLIFGAAAILLLLIVGIGLIGLLSVHSLAKEQARARQNSLHDHLTGVLNRPGLSEYVENLAPDVCRSAMIGLYLVDIDGFKAINDVWGQQVGDKLLGAVAARLAQDLPLGTAISRLDGDQFAIVSLMDAPGKVPHLQSAVSDVFAEPFKIGRREIEIGVSVGVTEAALSQANFHDLLRQGEMALHQAKHGSDGATVVFHAQMEAELIEQAKLEQQLVEALDRREIKAAFQPVVDARSGDLCGVEALARWNSESGPIAPDVFIPVAERAGLIGILGSQILEEAVAQGSRWPGLHIAVNVSPLQLRNRYFAGGLKATLDKFGFEPNRLTIELTEGVLISNADQAKRSISEIKALGIKVALDDFGSGFASIGSLRQFRFDRVKLDKSLVANIEHDAQAAKVLDATIKLVNALGVPVTVEGIENRHQAEFARQAGSHQLQGYWFSKPLSKEELAERFLRRDCLREFRVGG
ncbi:putative bifunctional diguanylate cyclase/phosphodiesterase [Aminobacter aminovorans]|uniref:Diguanylate cyclase (GGDEF)-like protein n=1 Tax=Aminobacter aminovorans TaxID=83263 RepID=A0AAC8YJE4_AMIAI|nr:EAL domain-containing protein [Aminobacter aminovorans]AMS39311.1 Sensory box/GGDEF family protein [Aminobacter aminovorans]MBB3709921.1 diguanylate cyclase (GGDEF)-like protein [Aminobacter aminovorans]WMC97416.1 EAL domain-containing protein [Aminobacter aminovorans]